MSYILIQQAVCGEPQAVETILHIYDRYINALSTVIEVRPDGTERRYVDEDMKAEIQTKYLEALPKCRVIK
ncbi:MAG: helix-turn-helix domain-containing protein [Ruminococcus flavefaciens]|nr:helix-turn-helix domain-containing protein [Ruminococcus flavefaciens]